MSVALTRSQALNQLSRFSEVAGLDYERFRNYLSLPDGAESVSRLSPLIRHRLLTEQEVVSSVLGVQSPKESEKFIQEVFWRVYWKSYLEQRPQIWTDYLHRVCEMGSENGDLYQPTGIECFDAWTSELVETGYLHNHARMWFASIWIFTLKRPWQLGGHFFLRHLFDGDPASNTLSWRWVAGLHTKGKTYLARPDNIAKYTREAFIPYRLANSAPPVAEEVVFVQRSIQPLPGQPNLEQGPFDAWLVFEDDLCVNEDFQRKIFVSPKAGQNSYSERVLKFKSDLLAEEAKRVGRSAAIVERIQDLDHQVRGYRVGAYLPPVGFGRSLAEEIGRRHNVQFFRRPWDAKYYPLARAGFFEFWHKVRDLEPGLKPTP